MRYKMKNPEGDVRDYDSEYDYYYEKYLRDMKGRYLERPPRWNEEEEERRRWS